MIYINDDLYLNTEINLVITQLKIELKSKGVNLFYKTIDTPNNYMICCPFHKNGQERKPSMGILKSNGTCHCFSCGWVGSLQEMISGCFGYDDWGRFGEKWLIKNFLSVEVQERNDIVLGFSRDRTDSNRNYVSEEELDSYRWTHPYWKKRGITDERLIELFDLGYDKETDCITMPVRDKSGHTLFVARRSVKTKFFNYPEGVEKPLYGLFEIWSAACKVGTEYEYGRKVKDYYSQILFPKEVIVCESMIDALTCWQYGKYAVALNGLGNNLQFKQLRELPCRKLIIATDNDEAGMRARKRIKKNVINKILTQYMIPKGKKDINDLTINEFNDMKEIFI